MRKTAIALAVFIAPSVARAAPIHEFVPVTRSDIPSVIYQGTPVDILGIEPRSTIASAEAIINKEFSKGTIERSISTFGGIFNGETVRFKPYISSIVASRPLDSGIAETIRVYFTSPTLGQRVVSVTRDLSYLDEKIAPSFEEAIASINRKYGQHTKPNIYGDGNAVGFNYVTKGGKTDYCKHSSIDGCWFINTYQAELASRYINQSSAINGLVVLIDLKRGMYSKNKLRVMNVQYFDYDFAVIAAHADLEEMQKAGNQKKSEPITAAMPKL